MLKNIVLHTPAIDNAGNYRDAGRELTVGDDVAEDVITLKRAQDLIDVGGAVSKTEAEQIERQAAENERAAGEEDPSAGEGAADGVPPADDPPAELPAAEAAPRRRK
jgi:hypothetical protein